MKTETVTIKAPDNRIAEFIIVGTAPYVQHNGGILRPVDIVEDAANPTSPLHTHFTWDDGEAAQRYRLIQAGQLIVRVRVTYTTREDRPVRVAAYQTTGSDSKGATIYERTEDVLSNDQKRAALLEAAIRELRAFELRYRDLVELGVVFEALAKLKVA